MKKEDILIYLNKRVYFILKSNKFNFTGVVKSIGDDSFILIDKFNEKGTFDISDISFMKLAKEVDDV